MVLTMKELYGPLKESRFILCVKSAKMNDEIANRRLLLLQSLKVHDAHLKMVNARGMTALHYACENELLDCIDTLLSWTPTSVVDPNIAGPEGWTPLLQAVLQGKGAVVERLLRYAAVDISRRGAHGKTALVYAASNGRDDIFETLLEEVATRALPPTHSSSSSSLSPSLLVTDEDAGHSCLEAAQREALREAINDCDDEGKTSLHRACMKNHIGVVHLLLSSKYVNLLDPNKADKYGRTPLISACDNGNTEIVRLLLLQHTSRKASWLNVNKADKFGRTSLLSAVNGAHRSVVDMLLTCPGIDVNHNDNLGWTAIVYAIVGCRNNEAVIQRARRDLRGFILSQRAILRSLLKHPGIDVNKPDKRGTSPLIYACSEARQDIVDLLLQMRKAPPPSPPSPSPSPSPPPPPPQPSQFSLLRGSISRLVSAAFGITPRATAQTPAPPPLPLPLWSPDEHMPSDTIFIDVNQSDIKESNCALHVAAEMGLVEICKLLCLQPGVDKNILNGQGLTPLSLAVIQSRLNVVKFMLQEPEIDVNKGEKGTPLMVACIRGNAQIAELLLSLSHCDVHRKSSDGDTALDFLRASAHPDQNLIDLLSQRAARGAAEA